MGTISHAYDQIIAIKAPFNICGLTAAQGGDINIKGGESTLTTNNGGDLNLYGGVPGTTANGGDILIQSGPGGTTSGNSGNINITCPEIPLNRVGAGGSITAAAGGSRGNGVDPVPDGGSIGWTGGFCANGPSGNGGALFLSGGTAVTTSGVGGLVNIVAGVSAGAGNPKGGLLNLQGGASTTGVGGDLTLKAGDGAQGGGSYVTRGGDATGGGNSPGGGWSAFGGTGKGSGAGGNCGITAGDAGSAAGAGGGTVSVASGRGASSGGVGGQVDITAADGGGKGGGIRIKSGSGTQGTSNAGVLILEVGTGHGSGGLNGVIRSVGITSKTQAAPAAKTGAATLTISELVGGLITLTQTSGGNVNLTLPTAALSSAGVQIVDGDSFDWSLINLSTGANTGTITGGTGHSVVGNGLVAVTSSGRFRSRRVSSSSWITYRIS